MIIQLNCGETKTVKLSYASRIFCSCTQLNITKKICGDRLFPIANLGMNQMIDLDAGTYQFSNMNPCQACDICVETINASSSGSGQDGDSNTPPQSILRIEQACFSYNNQTYLGYKVLKVTEANTLLVRYEWADHSPVSPALFCQGLIKEVECSCSPLNAIPSGIPADPTVC